MIDPDTAADRNESESGTLRLLLTTDMQSSDPDPPTTDGKTGGDGEAVLTLNVKSSTGGKFTVEVESLDENVSALKQRLEQPSGFSADAMRLIYKGRVLKDDERMQELCDKHGLESGHTMHLVRGARPVAGAGASTGAATTPAGAPPPPPPTPASGAADSGAAAPAGAGATSFDMFALPGAGGGAVAGLGALGGAAAAGGGGGGGAAAPNFQQQLQQQLLANPGAMQELLNSPLMDSMAENPELMRSLMMANPQVRDLVNENPEIAHLLSDPTVLRQTMQMMRNPRLMQEMMRNNDRAMANLEAMPGGFDALRRMYSDLQVPLENAASATQQQQPQPQPPLLGAANPAAPGTGTDSAQQQQPPSSNLFGAAAAAAAAAGQNPADGSRGPFGAISQDAVLQAMRSIVDNPELLRMVQEQIVSSDAYMWSNPMVAAMAAQNPQMQRALQDSEFRRRLFSADFFRAALALQEAQLRFHHLILTALREGGYEGAASAPYAAPPPFMFPNPGDRPGGAPAASPPPPDPTVSMTREQLEQHFASQLQQLREMGFYDTDACITALRATGGNVSAALDRLLNSF